MRKRISSLTCEARFLSGLSLLSEGGYRFESRSLQRRVLPHTPPTHTPARAPPELPFDLDEEVSCEANAVQEQPDWENVDQSVNW